VAQASAQDVVQRAAAHAAEEVAKVEHAADARCAVAEARTAALFSASAYEKTQSALAAWASAASPAKAVEKADALLDIAEAARGGGGGA